jgi:acylphosphatase
MQELCIHIFGDVQGVNFRWFVRAAAERRGITGYVQNLEDRSVEVVAQGNGVQLQQFFDEIKFGPRGSHVERVERNVRELAQRFDGFVIRD